MANNGSQYLGELQILVSADWSELQSDLQEAQQYAQQAGAAIANAFSSIDTSAAETALDDLFESIAGITDASSSAAAALSSITEAAASVTDSGEDAADGLSAVSDAVQTVADASDEASAATDDLASSLTDASGSADDASGSITDLSDAVAGVAGDTDDASSSLADLSDAAEEAGDAASGAVGGIEDLSAATEEAGENADEAGSGLSAFRASLLELAEGLAVTEGIKDLGEEALTAYSSIQTATVSLTALTGSASTASGMIEELEDKAQEIPVSLEGMVQAAQKMQAFGLSTEQTSEMLSDAANAAAATGSSFDSVSQRLEMMVASGTAGGRALASLGLTTQSLADALNQVDPALNATQASATTAFKALDESDRIDVLNTALEKFGDIAAAQAQTVAGQWTILKNQWDETLEVVGEDLAPLAQMFMGWASTAVSAIKSVADGFASLPAPFQDVIGIATVALGASGPLLTGLAALSLAVMGLQSVPEVFERLTAAMGSIGAAAPEVEAAAEATQHLAAAETELGAASAGAGNAGAVLQEVGAAEGGVAATSGSVEGLATSLGLAGGAGVALGVVLTGAVWYEATQNFEQLTKQLQAMQAAMASGQGATSAQAAEIANLTQQINNYNASASKTAQIPLPNFDPATESITQYVAALQKAASGIQGLGTNSVQAKTDLMALQSGGVMNLNDAIANLSATTQGGITLSKSASTEAETLNAAYLKQQATVASLQEIVRAYTQSVATGTPILGEGVITSGQLADAQTKLAEAQKQLTTMTDGATASLSSHKQVMDSMANATVPTYAQSVETAMGKIQASLNAANADLQVETGVWVQLQTSGTASAQAIADAAQKMQADLKKTGDSASDMADIVDQAMSGLGVSFVTLNNNWQQAVAQFGAGSTQAQAAFNALSSIWQKAGGTLEGLVTYVNNFTTGMQTMSGVMVNGQPAWVQANQDIQQMYQSLLSVVPGFNQATGAADGTVTVIRGSHAPIQEAIGDVTAIGNVMSSSAGATSSLGAATGQATSILTGMSNAVQYAKTNTQGYVAAVGDTVAGTQNLTQSLSELVNEFNQSGDPAIQAQIEQMMNLQEAAEEAADAVNDLSDAEQGLGKSKGGGAGGGGTGGFAVGTSPEDIGWNSTQLSMMPFVTGNLPGFGGVGLGVDGQAAYDALTASMNKTTASTNALSHALTGGSLAPSLDTTTEATVGLDQAQQQLAQSSGAAVSSTSMLQTTLKSLVTGLGSAPTSNVLSAGDPLSLSQLQNLVGGGTQNTSGYSGQQLAIINQDVTNYTKNMAAYTAAMEQYQTAVSELNSAVNITEQTTGNAANAMVLLGNASQVSAATETDLSNAVTSLAGVQGSAATSASDLESQISNLQQQLYQTQSDAGGSAASLEATNTAASALQDGMGELYTELQAVEAGGTAAQGAAEYLSTTFGDNESGLTGALNANAQVTGTATSATSDLTSAVGTLGTSSSSAAASLTSASQGFTTSVTTLANGVQQLTSYMNGVAEGVRYLYGTTQATNATNAPAPTPQSNYLSQAPQGTQVSPTQIDTPQGQYYLTANGWELVGATSIGQVSTTSGSSVPQSSATAALSNYSGANASGGPTSGPPDGSSWQQGQTQVAAANNAGEWYWEGNRWVLEAQTAIGPLNTQWQGASNPSYIAPTAYGQDLASGGSAPQNAPVNITINMSGITPGNATQLSNQVINSLRLNAGLKVT